MNILPAAAPVKHSSAIGTFPATANTCKIIIVNAIRMAVFMNHFILILRKERNKIFFLIAFQ
jgi:hypothetical protein